ncbi:hypothetical protein GC096_00765 [Paenibacillus sp. LMG 31461]|uniref:DUF3139 domain-containing protein n=1 Tax=Paenibacillus plantarum TaxID=2654975 RepID=A0ABX1X2G3_9BACL|nr:hypothetical protein [Paenibacillus plantarum]NOU62575.1 hypothetical protein [Paenibacillus plantarum]
MLPLYGKISLTVCIIIILFSVFLMHRFQQSKPIFSERVQWILSPIMVVLLILSVVFVLIAKDQKHRLEMANYIENTGAVVISIESSRKSLTPFKDLDKGKARPKDDYYIVTYSLEDKVKMAWFKGDNALYKGTPTSEKEKMDF